MRPKTKIWWVLSASRMEPACQCQCKHYHGLYQIITEPACWCRCKKSHDFYWILAACDDVFCRLSSLSGQNTSSSDWSCALGNSRHLQLTICVCVCLSVCMYVCSAYVCVCVCVRVGDVCVGTVWVCVLISVWLRGRIHVLRGCGKLRGSTRCSFLLPRNVIKTYTCVCVYVCVCQMTQQSWWEGYKTCLKNEIRHA